MDKALKKQTQRLIQKAVSGAMSCSDDKLSSQFEGQFGGETWEEKFTEIVFYLQYTPQLDNFKEISEIVKICIEECRLINRGNPLRIDSYFFSNGNSSIKPIKTNIRLDNEASKISYFRELDEFKNGVNVKTITNLPRQIKRIDDNGLVVFITDENGCDLGEKELKIIKHQSIWFKINDQDIELIQGLPKVIMS